MKKGTYREPVGADHDEPAELDPWIPIGEDPDDQRNARLVWRDLRGRYDIDHACLQSFFYWLWCNRNHCTAMLKGERVRQWALFLFGIQELTRRALFLRFPSAAHLLWTASCLAQCGLWVWAFFIALKVDDNGKPHPDVPRPPGFFLPFWAALMTGGMALGQFSAWLGLGGVPDPDDEDAGDYEANAWVPPFGAD